MDAIEKALVVNARGVMIGKHVVSRPDFFRPCFLGLEQDCSGAITGGKED